MILYKYLAKKHIDVWINGGKIPIKLASKYISEDRVGTMTPDENSVAKFSAPISDNNANRLLSLNGKNSGIKATNIKIYGEMPRSFSSLISLNNCTDTTINNVTYNTNEFSEAKFEGSFNQKLEDVLVLCFCEKLEKRISEEFKHDSCIIIEDILKLKQIIDDQIGVSIFDNCDYTSSIERNHFLKSDKDSWQHEYRMVWKLKKDMEIDSEGYIWVNIPGGIAQKIDIPSE